MLSSVLFVDDDVDVLSSIDKLFTGIDLNVFHALNADEAFEIIGNEEIAVIVSDYAMPGMKGTELLSRVKSLSPDTLRMLMTTHRNLDVAVNAINEGEIFRFIVKPWDNEGMAETVQEAVHRYSLIQSLRNNSETTLLSVSQTIELKDPYTRGHCERVARYSLMTARELGLSAASLDSIKYGSWLHDCGKIGVPEHILNKAGPLDEMEFDIIKKHPDWGAEVARQANLSQTVINIILYHHERYDGSGYPSGIQGEKIPIEAKIVAVSDIFDALTSDRAYRAKYDNARAVNIILKMSGNILDPVVIDAFVFKGMKFSRGSSPILSG